MPKPGWTLGTWGKGGMSKRDSATPSPDSTASSEAVPIDGDQSETVSPSPWPSATLTVDLAAPLTTGAVTEDPEEPGGFWRWQMPLNKP